MRQPPVEICGPDYAITPPQANNLSEVIMVAIQLHNDGYPDISRWLERGILNRLDKSNSVAENRSYGYHLNAARWLRLINPGGTLGNRDIHLSEFGKFFIGSSPSKRVDILRQILLQDPVYCVIEDFHSEPSSFLLQILTDEITNPRNPWRNAQGQLLAKTTAKRRASCAMAWASQVGIR